MIVLGQESALGFEALPEFLIQPFHFVLVGQVIPSAGFHICKMCMMTTCTVDYETQRRKYMWMYFINVA